MLPDADRTLQSDLPCPANWLIPYREVFLAELETLGYAHGTSYHYRHAIDLFLEQVAVRGLGPGDVDAAGVVELQDAVPVPRSRNAIRTRRSCVARFVEYLVSAGAIVATSPEPPPAVGWLEQLDANYGDWLRCERGLSESSITNSRYFLRRFLIFLFGEEPGDLNDIGPEKHPRLPCPAICRSGTWTGSGDEGGASASAVPVHVHHRADLPQPGCERAEGRVSQQAWRIMPSLARGGSQTDRRRERSRRRRTSRSRRHASAGPARSAQPGDHRAPARRH